MRLMNMVSAVEVHAAGEPGRVITGGVFDVPGRTMFEKKVYLETHADGLRRRMLREPRGYPALCCNIILPAANPAADIGFVIMESGPPLQPGSHRRNAVTVSSGEFRRDAPATWTGVLDRSPCGTGTSAKMAALHAKGQLGLNQDFVHESVIGTQFTGRLVAEGRVGPYSAVTPTISGRGWITGFSTYVLDPDDPFPEGFTVGDIWA